VFIYHSLFHMETAYPLTLNFSENCVQWFTSNLFQLSKVDGCIFNVNNHQVEMYEIAWLQFVIKLVHQEIYKLQKLDRCDVIVEILLLFESSAQDSVTKSCSRWLTTTSWLKSIAFTALSLLDNQRTCLMSPKCKSIWSSISPISVSSQKYKTCF